MRKMNRDLLSRLLIFHGWPKDLADERAEEFYQSLKKQDGERRVR